MQKRIVIEEKKEKSISEDLRKRAVCEYFRISGRRCLDCPFVGTKRCVHPNINQSLISDSY